MPTAGPIDCERELIPPLPVPRFSWRPPSFQRTNCIPSTEHGWQPPRGDNHGGIDT
nr:hypothetical protein [Candidatus Sigynarchaeum springense]